MRPPTTWATMSLTVKLAKASWTYSTRFAPQNTSVVRRATILSEHSQACLNKVRLVSSTNSHVRPCNLKPEQKDLTAVLRRPVEPAGIEPAKDQNDAMEPQRTSGSFLMIVFAGRSR